MGRFARSATNALGAGKLMRVDHGTADIEYFVSPAEEPLRDTVTALSVAAVDLLERTRVYWRDVTGGMTRVGWLASGRIAAAAIGRSEDHYRVRFPNSSTLFELPESQLQVRCNLPVADPTPYLAFRFNETPFFHAGRAAFLTAVLAQRAAFEGLTALASASIELKPHQVAVVRRVLRDAVPRYLLADEVGLGKTIEACVVISQHLHDHPDEARVLVVVPRHLVGQWSAELESKFDLIGELDFRVHVVPNDAHDEIMKLGRQTTMLVVDEAHQPALSAFAESASQRRPYEVLLDVAARSKCVLLLSATPVLNNEDGFLAMLHLLDPATYGLEPSERNAFRRRIKDRERLGELHQTLHETLDEFFLLSVLAELENLVPDDAYLLALCREARALAASPETDATRVNAMRVLRTHIAETQRLDRRLLRTRRDQKNVAGDLPTRVGVDRVSHEDPARLEAFAFLDAWRVRTAASLYANPERNLEAAKVLSDMLDAAFSHPLVLMRHLETPRARPFFDGEEEMIREVRAALSDVAGTDRRIEAVVDWHQNGRSTREKLLLFVDVVDVADKVGRELRARLPPGSVIRHEPSGESVAMFLESKTVTVLVCDRSAEEGLNLQSAPVVNHRREAPRQSPQKGGRASARAATSKG